MKPPIQMLDDYKRAKFREDLLSRTNNGVVLNLIEQLGREFPKEDASTQLDRLLTRQEYVGGAE